MLLKHHCSITLATWTAGQVCWKHWRLSWWRIHREVNKIWRKTVTVHLGSGTLERWIRFRCHLAVICCYIYVSAFCCIYKKEGSTSHVWLLTLVQLYACSLIQLSIEYTANVYGGLRSVCRFSLQYLWKRAVRITEKLKVVQKCRLLVIVHKVEMSKEGAKWQKKILSTNFVNNP